MATKTTVLSVLLGVALALEGCSMRLPALRAPPAKGPAAVASPPAISAPTTPTAGSPAVTPGSDRSTLPASRLPPAGVSAGQPAPDFALANPGGQTVRLSDFRGQPVVVNFFATWCGPCKEELPRFQAAYQRYRDRGLQVILVDLKESPADVGAFASRSGLSLPIVVDERGTVAAERYRLTGLPTTIFVDATGVIRGVQTGPLSEEALTGGVSALLGGATVSEASAPSGECCALP